MARTIGQESIDLTQVVVDAEALQARPAGVRAPPPGAADRLRRQDAASLTVAITEIFNVVALDQLRATLGPADRDQDRARRRGAARGLHRPVLRLRAVGRRHPAEIETGEIDYQSLQAGGDEYTQPIVRLVDALLVDAVKRGASDIHFEPEYAFLRIRYRIDGVLEQVRSLHKNYWPGIAVRVKVISGMNIAETRAPQDGRISLNLNGRPVDFRVSTPAHHPRREHRAARCSTARSRSSASTRWACPSDVMSKLQPHAGAARRHPDRHRPDRQRQDHHALLAAVAAQRRVGQHHDARGPGRVPGHA